MFEDVTIVTTYWGDNLFFISKPIYYTLDGSTPAKANGFYAKADTRFILSNKQKEKFQFTLAKEDV